MCLRVTSKYLDEEYQVINRAESEIVCYKVILKDKDDTYRTPFQKNWLSWLAMHGLKRFKAYGGKIGDIIDTPERYEVGNHEYKYVYGGVIHTFAALDSARDCATYIHNQLIDDGWGHIEIWECVIPRRVKYLIGVDEKGHYCYGSESIKFKRKLE